MNMGTRLGQYSWESNTGEKVTRWSTPITFWILVFANKEKARGKTLSVSRNSLWYQGTVVTGKKKPNDILSTPKYSLTGLQKGLLGQRAVHLSSYGDRSDCRCNTVTNQPKFVLVNLFFPLKVFFLWFYFYYNTKSRPNWKKKETKRPPNKLFIWKTMPIVTVCRQFFVYEGVNKGSFCVL